MGFGEIKLFGEKVGEIQAFSSEMGILTKI
jgi:hypothetical protein